MLTGSSLVYYIRPNTAELTKKNNGEKQQTRNTQKSNTYSITGINNEHNDINVITKLLQKSPDSSWNYRHQKHYFAMHTTREHDILLVQYGC